MCVCVSPACWSVKVSRSSMANAIPTLPSLCWDLQGQVSPMIDFRLLNCPGPAVYCTDAPALRCSAVLLFTGQMQRRPRWNGKPTILSLKRFSILRYFYFFFSLYRWWGQSFLSAPTCNSAIRQRLEGFLALFKFANPLAQPGITHFCPSFRSWLKEVASQDYFYV